MPRTKVVFEFENEDMATWFFTYMNCWGEQSYFEWINGGCNRPDFAVANRFTYTHAKDAYNIKAVR